MNFMNNNRQIIGILAIVTLFGVYSNAANALERTSIQTQIQPVASKEALSVSKEEILDKYKNAVSLTDLELKELLHAVGFSGKDLKEAWAVAKKESNGQPIRFNGNKSTGDSSFGLFQINMIGDLGPSRRDKFDLDTNAELFNPVVNAQIAFHMSAGGKNWTAWKGMTPRTLEWLSKFPA
jgi:hypothetical protein